MTASFLDQQPNKPPCTSCTCQAPTGISHHPGEFVSISGEGGQGPGDWPWLPSVRPCSLPSSQSRPSRAGSPERDLARGEGWPVISLLHEFCLETHEGGKLTRGPPAFTSRERRGAFGQASYSQKASNLDLETTSKSLLRDPFSSFLLLNMPGAPVPCSSNLST